MGIPNYCVEFEGQYNWVQIGSITATQTALGATDKDNASVAAIDDTKKVIWQPDDGTAAAMIRFRSDSAAGGFCTMYAYAAKGADYYTQVGKWTVTIGTQDWSGGHFADDAIITDEHWQFGYRLDNENNGIARIVLNTGGYDRFLFICSSITNITTLYVDIARLDQRIAGDVYSAIVQMAGDVDMSDVVSAVHDEGDNQIAEISDAASQVKSAVDDVATAVATADSVLSNALHSVVSQCSNIVEQTLNTANKADSIIDAVDEVRSGILSAATEEQSILHSMLDDTSGIVANTVTIANNTDSTVDAVDEVKTEVSDAISNLKSCVEAGLDQVGGSGHCHKATLSAGLTTISAYACRTCMVKPDPANTAAVRVQIGSVADANDGPLDAVWCPIPVDNGSDLNFYSTDSDAIVYVLYRD